MKTNLSDFIHAKCHSCAVELSTTIIFSMKNFFLFKTWEFSKRKVWIKLYSNRNKTHVLPGSFFYRKENHHMHICVNVLYLSLSLPLSLSLSISTSISMNIAHTLIPCCVCLLLAAVHCVLINSLPTNFLCVALCSLHSFVFHLLFESIP